MDLKYQSDCLHHKFEDLMKAQTAPLKAELEKVRDEAREWQLKYHGETLLRERERLDQLTGAAPGQDTRPISAGDIACVNAVTDISRIIAACAGLVGAKRPRTDAE